ncbi:MAG TPA: glycosyl hydrolase family 18 protein [Solirubrobacteraceae bacterium]|jgi:spore germination protein YaaH
MRRSSLLLALALPLLAAAPAHAAGACPKPSGLKVVKAGPGKVVLRWRKPRRGPFRVLRGKRVVGQTPRHSMPVNLRPGRRVKLGVGIVRGGGRAPRCYARITAKIKPGGPVSKALVAPAHLRIERVADGVATVGWDAVAAARRYRVFRDGVTVGETAALRYGVRVTAGRSASVTVASVGAGGAVGHPSAPLDVRTDRRAPGAPTGLRVDGLTAFGLVLSWDRGAAGSAPIRGFRVARDGQVISQVSQTSLRLAGLLPSTHYVLTVTAVDTQGLPSAPATLQVDTPAPDPTSGSVHAFLLATTSASFTDFRDHYQRVGTLYPTYFDCDKSNPARILGKDDPQVTAFAHARGVPVLPRYNCQNPTALRAVLNDPSTRQAVISGLVGLVKANGYDGINLDIEAGAPSDRPALSAFVATFANAMHAAGARLCVDVSPKTRDVMNHPRSTFYDYPAIARAADTVLVMAWGQHWTTSGPGPLVDLTWLAQVAGYVRTVPGAERFVISTASYGFDWPAGGGPSHPAKAVGFDDVQALLAATGAQPVRDQSSQELHFTYTDASGTGHEVWYRDATSITAGFNLARGQGLGFALWRLGQEDEAIWNTL